MGNDTCLFREPDSLKGCHVPFLTPSSHVRDTSTTRKKELLHRDRTEIILKLKLVGTKVQSPPATSMHLPAFSMCPASQILPGSAHLMTNKLHCYEINPLVYSSSSHKRKGKQEGFVFSCIPTRCYCTSSSCRKTCFIPALFMGPVSLQSVNPHRELVTQTLIQVCRLKRTFSFQKPFLNHYRFTNDL